MSKQRRLGLGLFEQSLERQIDARVHCDELHVLLPVADGARAILRDVARGDRGLVEPGRSLFVVGAGRDGAVVNLE